ncbi:hypothetical protein ORI89_03955 [Sphingobacterium sp. UT-1RO-CII-1]|uniref:hypothetical protein n=1 Tax=Sphingobacterium sp. UT-1RO-CII-1 TaxID=2995225 RepID=UPI00227BE77C|nr:hypothetical protein [Sphingobacterium sp. UT-1RO-CII-1]MCY4778793.1 hypothetical protein [Sphingobacterium sp. UT-1RO-CII-1]
MSTLQYIKSTSLLFFLIVFALVSRGQIVLNTTPQTSSAPIGNFGNLTVSVPSEVLTGDNITLNITLPGLVSASCVKTVTVTHSDKVAYQAHGTEPFSPIGPYTYQNSGVLTGNDGMSFNIYYKFPGYVTCNGTEGSFDVTLTINCGGVEYTATVTVRTIGRAANYWTVTKEFFAGNLLCGTSRWLVSLVHNNPNGAGLGTYSIQGTLTEDAPVDVIEGAFLQVGPYTMPHNSRYVHNVYLRNCAPAGSTIENKVKYKLKLGDDCETMEGEVTAASPPIASPNARLSFSKNIINVTTTNLTPGCQGRYAITLSNSGNIPWTNIKVTDDFNIPGISIIPPLSLPTGWTETNSGGIYTFDGGTTVLNPGDQITITIPFSIDQNVPIGTEIENVAVVSYQADGVEEEDTGGGSGTVSCLGVDCPEIDTSIQNDTASVKFKVEEPRPIPTIRKCLVDPPSGITPPLYSMDDQIKFSIIVWNTGAGSLSELISDNLAALGQNLQIDPSSIHYEYYTNAHTGFINECNPATGTLESTIPFSITANTANLQHPTFAISNMPGVCQIQRGNYLKITFSANILPQMYGTKTNIANMTFNDQNLSASVNYTIDQGGQLGVEKRADREAVENGQVFNYILKVKNKGTVPLHSVKIIDDLPSCVVLDGAIVARNMAGAVIPHTSTGNLEIHIESTAEIMPGEEFTVTVPVRKTQNGTCCNVDVIATAIISTSGILLDASDGTEDSPAACVSSTECCDIPDFSAELIKREGKYIIQITGGAVPIQELDISMLDFHVSYNQEDCKPLNLGVFGQLTSNTTQVGGLVLQNTGPAGVLTWGLGQPSVVNGQLEVEVSLPEMLDISCCEMLFTFCLKVRIKDVNCNVCEKTICYNGEPEVPPCDIELTSMSEGRTFCPGDVIDIAWSGATSSGFVDVYLMDGLTNTIYQVLAHGVSGLNSLSFTIPSDFPCGEERVWYLLVTDPKGECVIQTRKFQITCCAVACDCGFWKTNDVTIKKILTATPNNQFENSASLLKKAAVINVTQKVECGGVINLAKGSYSFTSPDFVCQSEDCTATYEWEITAPSGVVYHGQGKTFTHQFSQFGTYNIKFTPICGNTKCEPCIIKVNLNRGSIGDVISLPYEGINFNF